MINEEWNKTQNDAPFVAFYDMRAVTFVLPDEMANVSITGPPALIPLHSHPMFMRKKAFENIVGKGQNVSDQHFLFTNLFQHKKINVINPLPNGKF